MIRAFLDIIARIRAEWEDAPDSPYRDGGLAAIDLVESDVYDELGEPDE